MDPISRPCPDHLGLGFGRIERALNSGLAQSGFVRDLASNAFRLTRPTRGYWFILRQYWRDSPQGQQFGIAPDMLVALVLRLFEASERSEVVTCDRGIRTFKAT